MSAAKAKRERLASFLYRTGVTSAMRVLPARSVLLVLNYHRIGYADQDLYDPGVFSATPEEFEEQISHLKRYARFVTVDECVAFANDRSLSATRDLRILITFDDGYLDNYTSAFPILRSLGVPGVFFLATELVGSNHVPWWDRIAYIMKKARTRCFELAWPEPLSVDIDRDGLDASLGRVLNLYKLPANTDPDRFLSALANATNSDAPGDAPRRFLDWTEAQEMLRGGMAIGSHTVSHHVLSQLTPERQAAELTASRTILTERLGTPVDSLAYPVGQGSSFSDVTKRLAAEAGYRIAFSFYGGVNSPGTTEPYDVKREAVGYQSLERFYVQNAVCRITRRFWP